MALECQHLQAWVAGCELTEVPGIPLILTTEGAEVTELPQEPVTPSENQPGISVVASHAAISTKGAWPGRSHRRLVDALLTQEIVNRFHLLPIVLLEPAAEHRWLFIRGTRRLGLGVGI